MAIRKLQESEHIDEGDKNNKEKKNKFLKSMYGKIKDAREKTDEKR
jgi:hypothetical protein